MPGVPAADAASEALEGSGDSSAIAPASSDALGLLASEVPLGVDGVADGETQVSAPVEPTTVTLANEFIEVNFTSRGGAIDTVAFLQTKRGGVMIISSTQMGIYRRSVLVSLLRTERCAS